MDINKEALLTLSEAARSLPAVNGRRPHCSSLWRWCRRGVRGVKLEYVRVGRRVCTTAEALSRFVNRLAAEDEQHDVSHLAGVRPQKVGKQGSQKRDREVREAEDQLEQAGI